MKLFKFTLLPTSILFLSACSNDLNLSTINDLFRPTTSGKAVKVVKGTPNTYKPQQQTAVSPKPSAHQTTTRRINTTECQDADDWYLDGYRVGKSFTNQKTVMLKTRMDFCNLSQLPSQFKHNWERGFTVGNNDNMIKKPHTIKSKKSKRA